MADLFLGAAEATGSESMVAYFSDDVELTEIAPPENVAFRNDGYPIGHPINGVFPVVPTKFKLSPSLAPIDIDSFDDDELMDAYIDLYGDFSEGSYLRGNLCCDGHYIDFEQFSKNRDWILLLRVDSFDPVHEMCWWDNGALCFLIRESDLLKQDFSQVIAYLSSIG